VPPCINKRLQAPNATITIGDPITIVNRDLGMSGEPNRRQRCAHQRNDYESAHWLSPDDSINKAYFPIIV
jgi:hypothetical protein